MNKLVLISILILIVSGSFIYFKNDESQMVNLEKKLELSDQENESVDIRAEFRIVTNGTIRSFEDEKYHNRSTDVYLNPQNPSSVIVKRKGITWSDFFKTLPSPMKAEKDCLTTGTGQTFCSNEKQKLKFELNGIEDRSSLDKEIKDLDYLLIEYK